MGSETDSRPMVEAGPRKITDVIDAMLEKVPVGEELQARLQWLKRDAMYKAPEQAGDAWVMGNEILSQELGPPWLLKGWQAEVVSIWMNAPISGGQDTSKQQ